MTIWGKIRRHYGCWTNYYNTRLKIHAQFQKTTRKTATQAAIEIGRGAANFVRRGCRVFARGFTKLRVNFQASAAIICPTTMFCHLGVFLYKNIEKNKKWGSFVVIMCKISVLFRGAFWPANFAWIGHACVSLLVCFYSSQKESLRKLASRGLPHNWVNLIEVWQRIRRNSRVMDAGNTLIIIIIIQKN